MFIPVFLFSVVLLVYTLKIMHFQEIIHFEAAENIVTLSWEGQLGGESYGKRMFESRTYHGVREKVNKEINLEANVYDENELYVAEVVSPIELKLPFNLFDDISLKDTLVARKWSGVDNTGEILGFEAMEHEDSDKYIYVFPRYGEKYHSGNCKYLAMSGRFFRCITLSEAISGGYSPCLVCR